MMYGLRALKLGSMMAIALLGAGAMQGCAAIANYQAAIDAATYTGIQQVKHAHDNELYVTQELVCNNSIGAVMRVPDAMRRNLIFQMCGGESAPTVTTVPLQAPASFATKDGSAASPTLGGVPTS